MLQFNAYSNNIGLMKIFHVYTMEWSILTHKKNFFTNLIWPLHYCLFLSDECSFADMKTFYINLCLVSGEMTNRRMEKMLNVEHQTKIYMKYFLIVSTISSGSIYPCSEFQYTWLAISRLPVNYRLTRRTEKMCNRENHFLCLKIICNSKLFIKLLLTNN